MTLREAQNMCQQIQNQYSDGWAKHIKWNKVFQNEDEIYAALKAIYIPQNRTAPPNTFKGYEYIYSYAFYVQKLGLSLSRNQMIQCKRLALEIKKAAAISDYIF